MAADVSLKHAVYHPGHLVNVCSLCFAGRADLQQLLGILLQDPQALISLSRGSATLGSTVWTWLFLGA